MSNTYTRQQVLDSGLPMMEMQNIFTQGRHGLRTDFFRTVQPPVNMKNTTFQFGDMAGGARQTINTGSATLEDIKRAWEAFKTAGMPKSDGSSAVLPNGNTPPVAVNTSGAGSAQQPQTVPAVSPNILESAEQVFNLVRENAVEVPTSAREAYMLLWEHMPESVKVGALTNVLSDALTKLASSDAETFRSIVAVLPAEARAAVLQTLEDRSEVIISDAISANVLQTYHISLGDAYGKSNFETWPTQVERIISWMGKDEDLNWSPTPEQRNDANRDAAVAAYRALAKGLRAEVAKAYPDAKPDALKPIMFDQIADLLTTIEEMRTVGRQWGTMTPEQQHAWVADRKKQAAPVEETPAPAAAAADAPASAPDAPKTGNRRSS